MDIGLKKEQFGLFADLPIITKSSGRKVDVIDINRQPEIDLHSYDIYIVAFSGGKDGAACVLHLLEQGIRPELWHHDIGLHSMLGRQHT